VVAKHPLQLLARPQLNSVFEFARGKQAFTPLLVCRFIRGTPAFSLCVMYWTVSCLLVSARSVVVEDNL